MADQANATPPVRAIFRSEGKPRFKIHAAREIVPSLEDDDLVEGLLRKGELSQVYGAPGAAKTFTMIDLALHVAAGLSWRGSHSVRRCASIYLLLEGLKGGLNRVYGWKGEILGDREADIPFAIIEGGVDLRGEPGSMGDVGALVHLILSEAPAALGAEVGLVVIDTQSRAMSGDENSSHDMAELVRNLDTIRNATGAHVALVHHAGKDAAKGSRGSTVIEGAVDTQLRITKRDEFQVLEVVKQRAMEAAGPFFMKLKQVSLGTNAAGKEVTTCVIEHVEDPGTTSTRRELSPQQKIALKALKEALADHGELPAKEIMDHNTLGMGQRVVSAETWRELFYKRHGDGTTEAKRKAFNRARDALLSSEIVGSYGGFVWVKSNDQ